MPSILRLHLAVITLSACVFAVPRLTFRAYAQASPAPVSNPTPEKHTCSARSTPMSPGDIALARNEYEKAISAYTSELAASGPDALRSHNGLVRALIAADKIEEAETAAQEWASSSPADPWTKTTLGHLRRPPAGHEWPQIDVVAVSRWRTS